MSKLGIIFRTKIKELLKNGGIGGTVSDNVYRRRTSVYGINIGLNLMHVGVMKRFLPVGGYQIIEGDLCLVNLNQ